MSTIHLVTTTGTFDLDAPGDLTVLEAIRMHNVPYSSCLILDSDHQFVSLGDRLEDRAPVWAYATRNLDYCLVRPEFTRVVCNNPRTEVLQTTLDGSEPHLMLQLSREEAINTCVSSVTRVLDALFETNPDLRSTVLQVALSPGGDGRVLAEALDAYASDRSESKFHCVIVATGHEDEDEHLEQATKLATRYSLPYTALGVEDAARLLGYSTDLGILASRHGSEFPSDEPEIMLTYWVQEVNIRLACDNARSAILFGFNREDIIAEALYLTAL